jgi:xylulokinase
MGERTPHLDPRARGVWFGLMASHTRGHMIRSILEGVAFSLRDSLEIFRELSIPVEQVRATGGGSRSPVWRQIQADIYGKELAMLQQAEGSAFGAALLAGVGVRTYSSPQETTSVAIYNISARRSIRTLFVLRSAQYDRIYRIYRSLYPATRELAHNLAELGT